MCFYIPTLLISCSYFTLGNCRDLNIIMNVALHRLMHRGLTSAAEALTKRIGARITEHNRTIFSQSPSGNKEMWELVRKVTGKDSSKLSSYANQQATAEQLNKHFAEISRDFHYESPLQKSTAFSHNIYSLNVVFSECLTK